MVSVRTRGRRVPQWHSPADDPGRTFTVVASVALVLSFVPDLALPSFDPDATLFGVVVLMAMRVAVAAICVAVPTDRAW